MRRKLPRGSRDGDSPSKLDALDQTIIEHLRETMGQFRIASWPDYVVHLNLQFGDEFRVFVGTT